MKSAFITKRDLRAVSFECPKNLPHLDRNHLDFLDEFALLLLTQRHRRQHLLALAGALPCCLCIFAPVCPLIRLVKPWRDTEGKVGGKDLCNLSLDLWTLRPSGSLFKPREVDLWGPTERLCKELFLCRPICRWSVSLRLLRLLHPLRLLLLRRFLNVEIRGLWSLSLLLIDRLLLRQLAKRKITKRSFRAFAFGAA